VAWRAVETRWSIRPRAVKHLISLKMLADRSPVSLEIKRAWRNDLGDGGGGEGMAGPCRGDERPDGHGWTWTREILRRGGQTGEKRPARMGDFGEEKTGNGLRFGKLSVSLCSPATEEVEIGGGECGCGFPSAAAFSVLSVDEAVGRPRKRVGQPRKR
jgi:hypothetical protein